MNIHASLQLVLAINKQPEESHLHISMPGYCCYWNNAPSTLNLHVFVLSVSVYLMYGFFFERFLCMNLVINKLCYKTLH